jgi:carbon storage regulator CsrA
MLIIKRCYGEKLIIKDGDDVIVITPIRSSGKNSTKLGIEAPQHVEVWREELYDNIVNAVKEKQK